MITPNATTVAAPGIHQRRPKRRMPRISRPPPAAAKSAPIASDLATSPAHPSQPWVTRPTSRARSDAIALTGSVATPRATEIAAAAAAPATTGRRRPARRKRSGGRRTSRISTPPSISRRAP